MQRNTDDGAVIEMVLQGRQAAYTHLVSRYQHYVFTLVLRYVKDRGQAEEVAQDVFVKAYRSLADFRGRSKFSTWLYTIVHTTCLSHLRKSAGTTLLLEEDKMDDLPGQPDGEDPLQLLERKAANAMVDQAIKLLPAQDAEALTLYYMAGQSVEEIAQITGLTGANVKVRLYRARGRLKAIIEREYARDNQLTNGR